LFKHCQNAIHPANSGGFICPVNFEMAVGAKRLKILVRAIPPILVTMMNGEMIQVLIGALFAADFAFSPDRDHETTDAIVTLPSQIFPQYRTSARTKHDILGGDRLSANRTRSLFRTGARTVILLVTPGCFDYEHLAASFAGKFLSWFLPAAEKAIRIFNPRLDGTLIGTKPRHPVSPKPSRKGLAAAFAFIDRLAVLRALRFEKTILRAKLWGAVLRPRHTAKSLLAVLAFVAALARLFVFDEAWTANAGGLFAHVAVVNFSATALANVGHLPQVYYNVWPGR
jgi:hypothetical protein